MEITYIIFGSIILFIVYINVLSSISIIKASTLDKFQKTAQIFITWLIPIIGAKFVLHVLSESDPESIGWIPQPGHGWLIIGNTYHESLHGREQSGVENSDTFGGDSGASGGSGGD